MAAKKKRSGTGIGVDITGGPVVDPTENVISLVEAAIVRQDDLRNQESKHMREILDLRGEHYNELRLAEAHRIDAIRAVDVGAVNRAAEVAAAQAATLATQVSTSAEAMRSQVAAAASASTIALAAALEPMQRSIDDLRRAQYEAQGKTAQVGDTRSGQQLGLQVAAAIFGLIALVLTVLTIYLATRK